MAKAKAKATIMVPNSQGEMVEIHDMRFEKRAWLIDIEIPKGQADTWLQYFSAECAKRGWGTAGINQLDRKENSGSFTVTTGENENIQLTVIWERKRNSSMTVKARSIGSQEFPIDVVNDFFFQINQRNSNRETNLFYRRGHLCYEGFPWRGEIWLDDKLRLGPPAIQDETALIGPRIIVVDMQINGIDSFHANSTFGVILRELSIFLTTITGININVSSPNGNRDWTWASNDKGKVESDVRNLGYWEKQWPKEMPIAGVVQTIPLQHIHRPELYSASRAYDARDEMSLPDDVGKLWEAFLLLPPDRKRQFLQVGSMWHIALSHYIEYRTLSFALMVVACESLKPSGEQFEKHNINHVIEALLGRSAVDLLQKYPNEYRPQNVRAAVLHLGEFRSSEFAESMFMASNTDPTFDEAYRELWKISQAAIIEWLSKGGSVNFPVSKDRTGFKKWIKNNLAIVMLLCTAIGATIGWFIQLFLSR